MARKLKKPLLDLSDSEFVQLEELEDLPICFGEYDGCSSDFCAHVFERCKGETDARSSGAGEAVFD